MYGLRESLALIAEKVREEGQRWLWAGGQEDKALGWADAVMGPGWL